MSGEEGVVDVDVSGGADDSRSEGGRFGRLKKGFRALYFVKLVVTIVIVIGLFSHVALVYRAANSLEYVDGRVESMQPTGSPLEYEAVFVAVFSNPTSTTIDVDRLSYSVYIEEDFVGSGRREDLSISPGTEEYAFEVTFSLEDLSEASQTLFLEEEAVLYITGEAVVPLKLFGMYRWKTVNVPYSIEEPVEFSDSPPIPPVPVHLSQPTRTLLSTDVLLEWTRSSSLNFTRYEVHMSTETGFDPSNETNLANISNIDETSFTVTGLVVGETYYFIIRVVDTTGLHGDSLQRVYHHFVS